MKKQKVVIVGGGTSGWVSAAILAKGLPADRFDISLIESKDVPTIGVGEATIPPIVLLLDYLEIDRKAFLDKVNGTYKYGIHFEGWSKPKESYMHAFGELGTPLQDLPFTDLWLKCASSLPINKLNDFSPTAIAAYQNKFHPVVTPPENANKNHFYPLAGMFYAYQFDAGLLVTLLSEYSRDKGVNHIVGTLNDVRENAQGYIESVSLEDGSKVEGDFFVDCSGMRGLLNKEHYKCEFLDWSEYLPCNSAIPIQTGALDPLPPYTKSIAMSAGWRWQIPLQNRTGNGYVFCDEFISEQDAMDEFMQALKGQEKLTEPRVIKFKTGYLEKPWFKNSVAIGLSSGFFEPLESTSIHLVHKFAVHFKNALLHGTNIGQEADLFNTSFNKTASEIRDFLVAHYHINQRNDTPFWRHCAQMKIPDTLRGYLDEFSRTGKITLPEESLFTYESYLQLLVGQQYLTSYQHLQDPNVPPQNLQTFFNNVNGAIKAEVAKTKSHRDYLMGT
jgi:tryptophan halogenase